MNDTAQPRGIARVIRTSALGIAAALVTLTAAAPAAAATAPPLPAPGQGDTPTTVTARSIPVTRIIDLHESNSVLGDFAPLPVSGNVEFPLSFTFGGVETDVYFRASGFLSDDAVPAGCTREVSGFTLTIADVSEPGQALQGVLTEGIPNALSSGVVSEYSGTGVLTSVDFGALVNFSSVGGPHRGTLSVEYATPIPWHDALPVVGLSALGNNANDPGGPARLPVTWTIGAAALEATDTCLIPPTQTPPTTTPTPSTTAAAAVPAALANTGTSVAAPLALGLIGLASGVIAAGLVRRRTTGPAK